MQTINNNILFDDFALLSLSGYSANQASFPITYGDCDNRLETETVEAFRPDDITVSEKPSIDEYN